MKRPFPLLAALLVSTSATFAGSFGPGPWANGAYYPGQYDGRYSANVYNNTQAGFAAGAMGTPDGNTVREDTFTVTPGTTNVIFGTTTVSNFFTTNITISNTVTNVGGLFVTSSVTTTSIVTTPITNTTPNITNITPARTNLSSSGAASVVSGVLGFGINNGTPTTGIGANTASTATTANSSITVQSIDLDPSLNYFVIYVDGDVFAGQTVAAINNNTDSVNGSLQNGVGRSEYLVVTNIVADTNNLRFETEIIQFPNATAGGYFNASVQNFKSPLTFRGAGELSVQGSPASSKGLLAGNAVYPFNVDGIKVSDTSTSATTASGTSSSTGGTAQ